MSHSVDEIYSVYVETDVRRARKRHVCNACEEPIPAGAGYTKIFIVFDQKPEWLKRCARCQKIHKHLRTLDPGDTWPDEKLDCGEEYRLHWGVEPPPEIAALAFSLPGEN